MNNYIYIIISQTGTNLSKIFKFFTKKPYNHVSISVTADLSYMYSFCRNYRILPIPATFNHEIVGKGTLGKFKYIPCEIYRYEITIKQLKHYNNIIKYFYNNRNNYSYNILGLPALYLNIKWNRNKYFVCSQFVAYTMNKIGIPLEKSFSLYTPNDFRTFPGADLYYIGNLNFFNNYKKIGDK